MKLFNLVLLIGITGCASKPPISSEMLNQFGVQAAAIDRCIEQGDMEPKLKAYSKYYIDGNINKYTWDRAEFEAIYHRARYVSTPPTKSYCKGLAGDLEASAPTNTNPSNQGSGVVSCNKVGTQTLCHSL